MQVLILPSWYPNPMKKDFAPYVRAQAQSLARSGLNVTVVYSAPYSWKWVFSERRLMFGRRESLEEGLREILFYFPKTHFKPLDLIIRNIWGRRLLRNLELERYRPDVIHAHTYEVGRLAIWFSYRNSVPVVLTEHFTGFARNLLGPWEMKLARESFQNADIRLAVSEPFAKLLEQRTACTFRVLPNYIDIDFFSPGGPVTPLTYDFIAVGHLLPKKNHKLLISSFFRLRPIERHFRLGIVGEGESRAELEALIRHLGLEDNVELLGYRNSEGVRNLLRESRIYCMPSLYETFGIAVIEAMALGLPAVVTPSGGPESVVVEGKTGLVAGTSIEAYAAALAEALETDWDREAIRHRTVELYSEQTVTAELLSIYNEAIGLRAKGQQ